jgi:hypothetical protein
VSWTIRDASSEISGPTAFNVGGGGGAAVTTWTPIEWTLFNGRPYIPQTPVINVTNVPAAGKFIRIRCRGLDQFGSAIEEITPWIAIDAVLIDTQCALSKVFSLVSFVEYQSIGLNIATDAIVMGTSVLFDPTFVDDNPGVSIPRAVVHPENLGLALPLRVSPYGRLDDDYEFSNLSVYGVTQSADLGANYDAWAVIGRYDPTAAVPAGFTIGFSAPGFQGCTHKMGIHRSDGWAAKFQTLARSNAPAVDLRLGGEAHVPPPSRAADTLKLTLYVRSRSGTRFNTHGASTRMGAAATTSYPLG